MDPVTAGSPDGWPERVESERYVNEFVMQTVEKIFGEKVSPKEDSNEGPVLKQYKEFSDEDRNDFGQDS